MGDILFGWDLTLKTVEKDLKRKSDVLIAFIHWSLIKRGFRAVGIGDERNLSGDEEKSETLPTGWNDNENYTLRYVLDNKLYVLHGLNTDGNLIINLLRSEDLAVSNIALKIEETVKDMTGPIDKILPTHKDLIFYIKRDLIDSVTDKPTTTAETQTVRNEPIGREPSFNDPLRIPPRPNPNPLADTRDLWLPPTGVPNVGGSDLDPFGAGGGMLFNPFEPRRDFINPGSGIPGGLPRGAVPPGARFDPFGPPLQPGPGRRQPPPDADHLPPPGFNDMFM